jgi:hypothetical protein
MWADLLATAITAPPVARKPKRPAALPPSATQTAKVAVCDHHPLSRQHQMEAAYV